MEDFKVIYKILMAIYNAMDYDLFDKESIAPEVLGITRQRRDKLLAMLVKSGYVEGVKVFNHAMGVSVVIGSSVNLTLEGLTYLQENSLMQKAAKAVKGIVDIIV